MATFLPYASCYGNKPALHLMGMNRRCLSFLGTPPCLLKRRSRHSRPTPELTVIQLTQMIRVLRQLPYNSPREGPQTDNASVSTVRSVLRFCHSKIFGNQCLNCSQDPNKQAL